MLSGPVQNRVPRVDTRVEIAFKLHASNGLVITRNWWLILLSKFWLFFKFSQTDPKCFQNTKDSQFVLIFCISQVVVELLAIL
jgi:hypothetical protein